MAEQLTREQLIDQLINMTTGGPPSREMISRGLGIGYDPLPRPSISGTAEYGNIPPWLVGIASILGIRRPSGRIPPNSTVPETGTRRRELFNPTTPEVDIRPPSPWITSNLSREQMRQYQNFINQGLDRQEAFERALRYPVNATGHTTRGPVGTRGGTGAHRNYSFPGQAEFLASRGRVPGATGYLDPSTTSIGSRELRRDLRGPEAVNPTQETPISVSSVLNALRNVEGMHATSRPAGRGTYSINYHGIGGEGRQLNLPLNAPRLEAQSPLVVRQGYRPDALLGRIESGTLARFDNLEALLNEIRRRRGMNFTPMEPALQANEPITRYNPSQLSLPLE